jgi:central glycolytic genes regulator
VDKTVALHRKIAPELIGVIEDRYNILRYVRYAQPIGRRALSFAMGSSERVVRAQTDFLKRAGLLDFSPLGMTLTAEGIALLSELGVYVRAIHGLSGLEQELAERLGLEQVVIIRGDSDIDDMVKRELGRAAASVLGHFLGNNMTIAVSGGSTMAQVAESINIQEPTTIVVPARGGLAERVEFQANTIAAVMASRLGGKYRLLHIPEGVGEEAIEAILEQDANIRAVVQMIRQADILLSGVGEASAMALRRGFDCSIRENLERLGAVGETLGHYCTVEGKVVYITSSVGLRLDDLASIGRAIAVAGGRQKAKAIVAVTAAGGQDILVTDEAAARAIQDIIKQ